MPMTLQNLLGISLDAVAADKAAIGLLMAAAERNLSDYSGDTVSEAAAAECITSAKELLAHVRGWLKANKPQLL
jgi:hypothetical protein